MLIPPGRLANEAVVSRLAKIDALLEIIEVPYNFKRTKQNEFLYNKAKNYMSKLFLDEVSVDDAFNAINAEIKAFQEANLPKDSGVSASMGDINSTRLEKAWKDLKANYKPSGKTPNPNHRGHKATD